jgi:ATP-dependent RNA helicase DDX24/MAK5
VEELGDLGEFEDAVFYSLEELDGNAIAAGVKRVEVAPSKEEDASTSESSMKKSIKAKRKRAVVSRSEANAPLSVDSALPVAAVFAEWSGIRFRTEVVCALERLGFSEPTPVQAKTIPAILRGGTDVVAAAETGSGKTLAFALPILDRLLLDWEACGASHCPFAIVLSPTRELAMQITSVFKDLCLGLGDTHDVSVVAVVGGMSVQKQRRLLFDIPRNRSAHVVVATPGRLCDMCEDAAAPSLSNLSRVRFLVVDEADRMVEDGHFPEVTKVLHRIRDHEGGSEWEAPRQTLLFSATLNYARDEAKAKRKVKGVSATARALPLQVQELLAVVAVGRTLEVFDLGSRREAAIVSTEADAAASSVKPAAARAFAESSPLSQLPKTLTQLEVTLSPVELAD